MEGEAPCVPSGSSPHRCILRLCGRVPSVTGFSQWLVEQWVEVLVVFIFYSLNCLMHSLVEEGRRGMMLMDILSGDNLLPDPPFQVLCPSLNILLSGDLQHSMEFLHMRNFKESQR